MTQTQSRVEVEGPVRLTWRPERIEAPSVVRWTVSVIELDRIAELASYVGPGFVPAQQLHQPDERSFSESRARLWKRLSHVPRLTVTPGSLIADLAASGPTALLIFWCLRHPEDIGAWFPRVYQGWRVAVRMNPEAGAVRAQRSVAIEEAESEVAETDSTEAILANLLQEKVDRLNAMDAPTTASLPNELSVLEPPGTSSR